MNKEELDPEALKVWADLAKGEVYDKGVKGQCCFCGKEFLGYGHDPRPIKVGGEENPRCCAECNARIVCATRDVVWGAEADKDREIKALKAKLEEQERELKYYEDEWKSCQQHLDHYRGECLNLQDQVKEAMLVADKTIRLLAKALELACKTLEPPDGYCAEEECQFEFDCWECRVRYFKTQARKELENE